MKEITVDYENNPVLTMLVDIHHKVQEIDAVLLEGTLKLEMIKKLLDETETAVKLFTLLEHLEEEENGK